LKIKLKGLHVDTNEVIETESEVPNTLAEHYLQDAFKNGRRAGNGSCVWKGGYSRVMMASRPKVSFDQMAAPVPEIMAGSLYKYCSK
jgi:hypothetical protein